MHALRGVSYLVVLGAQFFFRRPPTLVAVAFRSTLQPSDDVERQPRHTRIASEWGQCVRAQHCGQSDLGGRGGVRKRSVRLIRKCRAPARACTVVQQYGRWSDCVRGTRGRRVAQFPAVGHLLVACTIVKFAFTRFH